MITNKIKITLIKSIIGRHPKHVNIVKQLGFGKLNSWVIHNDTTMIRGLTNKIDYLLKIEECK